MAKRLMYICAGIALIVVSLRLGPSAAGAQGVAALVGSFDGDTDPVLIDATGSIWMMGWSNSRGTRVGPVSLPKSGHIIAISVSVMGAGSFDGRLLYEDGDAYIHNESGWQLIGNVLGGSTAAESGSWGALKMRYR